MLAIYSKKILLIIILLIFTVGISFFSKEFLTKKSFLILNNFEKTKIEVILAKTETERTRGLSGSKMLEKNHGMLFIFPNSDRHGFWMKEMNYPIDIIWLDENYSVIDTKENAEPNSYPEIFAPKLPAKYFLEVPAGFSLEKNIKIGIDFIPEL
jgi:uncharacterized membrane protein (UPF0127 family)